MAETLTTPLYLTTFTFLALLFLAAQARTSPGVSNSGDDCRSKHDLEQASSALKRLLSVAKFIASDHDFISMITDHVDKKKPYKPPLPPKPNPSLHQSTLPPPPRRPSMAGGSGWESGPYLVS